MAQVVLLTIYPIEKKGPIVGWYGLSVGATPVDEKVFSVGSLPMDGIKMLLAEIPSQQDFSGELQKVWTQKSVHGLPALPHLAQWSSMG